MSLVTRENLFSGFSTGKTRTGLLSYENEQVIKLQRKKLGIVYCLDSENKGADQTAQADLRLCCSHMA